MLTFWLQFALVLATILIGIRRGGVALGMLGGFGVTVLTFGFGNPPSDPPIVVMLIILAVVTASATLQVAGGLDWLVQRTERLLRAHPKRVTILAPLCTFFLTVCVGTGHAVYSLLPVIADVALKTNIRPERPMAISSVASQMGITASPVAAAVTTFLAMTAKSPHPVGLLDIIKVTMPAGIVGVLAAALWSMNRGQDLDPAQDITVERFGSGKHAHLRRAKAIAIDQTTDQKRRIVDPEMRRPAGRGNAETDGKGNLRIVADRVRAGGCDGHGDPSGGLSGVCERRRFPPAPFCAGRAAKFLDIGAGHCAL